MSLFDELRSALPLGEWGDLREIPDPDGMMAQYSVHASATWLRGGGVPAYLKCLQVAGRAAGPETERLVGNDRLTSLAERLRSVQAANLPGVVRLLKIEQLATPPVLLVAMEHVERLHEVIEKTAPNVDLSVAVLESLNTDALGGGWIHFDICPRNTALTAQKRCVLIDPDSLCACIDSTVEVSVPACKQRIPAKIHDRWKGTLTDHGLPLDVAREKHNAEVIALSADCSLGVLQHEFTSDGVDKWLTESPAPAELRSFWRPILLSLVAGTIEPAQDIAGRLKRLGMSITQPAPGSIAKPLIRRVEIVTDTNWEGFEPLRRELRADRLTRPQLRQYREALVGKAQAAKVDPKWWEEAVLVAMAYERDPETALQIVIEALAALPTHETLKRDQKVLRLWARQ